MDVSKRWEEIDNQIIQSRIESVVQATGLISDDFSGDNLEQLRSSVLALHHAVSGSLAEFQSTSEVISFASSAVKDALVALQNESSTASQGAVSELRSRVEGWCLLV